MDGIRQWALSACVAMIACGISGMILPKSNLQKVFGITISAFFLCALAAPAAMSMPEVTVRVEEHSIEDAHRRAEALEEAVTAQTEEAARESIRKIIAARLSEMGINDMDITINIIMNGQSGYAVESADVTLDSVHEPDHDVIRKRLEQELGFTVRLGYRDAAAEDGGQKNTGGSYAGL